PVTSTLSLHDALPICHHRLDLYRFAVQNVRPVTPLLHGFEGRLDQKRRTADDAEVLDGSLFADFRLQHHTALHTGGLRNRWVNRDRKSTRLNSSHQII